MLRRSIIAFLVLLCGAGPVCAEEVDELDDVLADPAAPPPAADDSTETNESTETDAETSADTVPVDADAGQAQVSAPPRNRLIEEIVVTAQRREESLQDVPISIAVMSGEALFDRNILDSNDLATAVPGLAGMNYFNRNETEYSMRGQGKAFDGSAPGVVPYFSDVPEFTSFMYDLENVQVLKGPQGTLFGKNTTGGAILFTPRRPTAEPDTNLVAVQLGDYGRQDLQFGFGGPLIGESFLYRFAGQRLRSDGYTENLFDGRRLDNYHRDSYRLSLLFHGDSLEILTIGQWEENDEEGIGHSLNAFIDRPSTPYQDELGPFLQAQKARGPREVVLDAPVFSLLDMRGAINTATWTFNPNWAVKNILSYKESRTSAFYDEDGTPFRIANAGYPRVVPWNRSATGELQLLYTGDRFDVTAGMYAEKVAIGGKTLSALLSTPVAEQPYQFDIFSARHDESAAAFAQATYRVLEDLVLALGYRHTVDDRTAASQQDVVEQGQRTNIQPRTHYARKFTADTWNASATYHLSPELTGYGTVRRGYKAGGFNTLTTDPERVAFDPEYLTDVELGLKASWTLGEWEMRASVDAYHDDYKNIQRLLTVPGSVPPVGVTDNAAAARVWGADLDLFIVPSAALDFSIQYAYIATKYLEYVDPTQGDLSQTDFPTTPQHQLTFIPALHLPLGGYGVVHPQLTVYYQSDMALYVTNKPNGNDVVDRAVVGSVSPAYTRYDFVANWDGLLKGTTLGVFARNLTDNAVPVGGVNALGIDIVGTSSFIYGPPRMYGVNLLYRF